MRSVMTVLEGVLAIHKPPSISSYDVIRTVTPLFRKSPLFQPLIDRERARKDHGALKRKTARKDRLDELKIGHGGTLDPLATGVLVVGIGNGTKSLQKFLDGTKEYECTVLFGAATDSYDIMGKVTQTTSWKDVTKEKVEAALETLKGDQMQLPPVFSAIRVNGKHLYDYAREGLPLPEIKKRAVIVHELEMVEWLPPEHHNFELPSEQADHEAKIIADRLAWPKSLLSKRKRGNGDAGSDAEGDTPPKKSARSDLPAQCAEETGEKVDDMDTTKDDKPPTDAASLTEATTKEKRPPAVRLRMVVSSGFYVRSLCHDLGIAVGSAGLMATLVRSRQSEFELGKNVIEFDDFEKGDDVWEPQVRSLLESWQAKESASTGGATGGGNGNRYRRAGRDGRENYAKTLGQSERGRTTRSPASGAEPSRRRNTSSPE